MIDRQTDKQIDIPKYNLFSSDNVTCSFVTGHSISVLFPGKDRLAESHCYAVACGSLCWVEALQPFPHRVYCVSCCNSCLSRGDSIILMSE